MIKEAAGNPGRRKLNEHEPIVPPGVPPPPKWLRAPGREHWFALAPTLVAMRVLTLADATTFGRYCQVLARYIELDRFLMRKGAAGTTYAIKDAEGKVRYIAEMPQATEFRRLHEILLRLEREFGLTPAARSAIKVESINTSAPAPAPAPRPANTGPYSFFAGGGPRPPRG